MKCLAAILSVRGVLVKDREFGWGSLEQSVGLSTRTRPDPTSLKSGDKYFSGDQPSGQSTAPQWASNPGDCLKDQSNHVCVCGGGELFQKLRITFLSGKQVMNPPESVRSALPAYFPLMACEQTPSLFPAFATAFQPFQFPYFSILFFFLCRQFPIFLISFFLF